MAKKIPKIYANLVLSALHPEFDFSNKDEAEAKIKRQLNRKKAGVYDQQRVDLLRRFKDEMQWEVGLRPLLNRSRPLRDGESSYKPEESRYYVGRHGKYGDYTDFDIPRMTADMIARYPEIPKDTVAWFVHFAVGTYYLL